MKKMYYGRVINVQNKAGNVNLDVQRLDSHGRIESNIHMEKVAPGFLVVPEPGWVVAIEIRQDGEHHAIGVSTGPEVYDSEAKNNGFLPEGLNRDTNEIWSMADNLAPGSIIMQLDRQSGMKWTPNSTASSWDLTLRAGGNINLEAGGTITQTESATDISTEDGFTQ